MISGESKSVATNMQDIQDRLKEQIKVQMFNMFPDEKVEELVQNEINAFFEAGTENYWSFKTISDGWGRDRIEMTGIQAQVSPFRLIVWEELNTILKVQIEAIFSSPEFLEKANVGETQVVDDIQKAALTRQQQIAVNMAHSVFSSHINDALRMGGSEIDSAIRCAVQQVMQDRGML